jgi:predicted PurR-regulated permease PerM
MVQILPRSRRNLVLLVLLVLVLWFCWTVRAALNPLLLAFLFAYMLHPMVLSLERRGWSRKRAVNVIYISAALFALLATAGVVLQARSLWFNLVREEGMIETLEARLTEAMSKLETWSAEFLPAGYLNSPESEGAPPNIALPSEVAPESEAGAGDGAQPPQQTEPDASGVEQAEPGATQGPEERPGIVASLAAELRDWIRSGGGMDEVRKAGGAALAFVKSATGSVLQFLMLMFLVPVYAWFLLFELERIARFVGGYVPVNERERVARIAGQIAEVLGNFFRGRLLVCLLKGLILSAVLAVLGVPYAFLLGLLSGFLSLVPFLGPAIGYGAAFLLSLTEFSVLGAAWRIALVFAAGELLEGYVLLPKILGDSLGIHPLVVIVSLTVAGAALGMFGLLLALPLTAAVQILAREVVLPLVKDWAEGRRPARSPPSTR